ncbi:hypothetical protein F5Y11DRAFT_22220 [Daldinia sp. FL1419]|nr:hypothetical protein F5Y11DRAFT_22220 [Daldinia sp. FL1419]
MECVANTRFTTGKWGFKHGKTLALLWTSTTDLDNFDLASLATGGFVRTDKILKDYKGNTTFILTPRVDLTPGDYVFHTSESWCQTQSPKLLLPSNFLHNKVPRETSSENTPENQGDDGLRPSVVAGIGVGSTLGGILLLALIAFLIHRGRRNRTKLEDLEAGMQDMRRDKQKEPQLGV